MRSKTIPTVHSARAIHTLLEEGQQRIVIRTDSYSLRPRQAGWHPVRKYVMSDYVNSPWPRHGGYFLPYLSTVLTLFWVDDLTIGRAMRSPPNSQERLHRRCGPASANKTNHAPPLWARGGTSSGRQGQLNWSNDVQDRMTLTALLGCHCPTEWIGRVLIRQVPRKAGTRYRQPGFGRRPRGRSPVSDPYPSGCRQRT